MCGRFALKMPDAVLLSHFRLAECAAVAPRFNIAPGTEIPVIRHSPEGKRVLHLLRWGLVPHGSSDAAIGVKLKNARAETLAVKPSFREAFRRRRCLIPADGFYEWRSEGRVRQPYYFSLKSGEPMALAGLWESWRAPDGRILRTVCLITTAANAEMSPVHDRMPMIVAPEHWDAWLTAPAADVVSLMRPCPNGALQLWPVDRRINASGADGSDLIQPLALALPADFFD